MGIFDRFRRKEQPPKRRSYAGVNTSRLFADFSTMTRSSDAELKPALRVLRNRCRELSRNDEYVRRYLGLLKTNVVGPYGVNVQAKARNADGSLDAPGNKIVENAWKAWGQRGNCTVDGRLSWIDAQRLFVETLARDGEVIISFVNGFKNIDSFSIEFVETDVLEEELNTKASNGNHIRMGVEVDDFGKAVAYHLLAEHPGDPMGVTTHVPFDLTKGSTSGTCSAMIFGDFSQLMMGFWSSPDVLVDPYTGGSAGNTRVIVMQGVDVAVRHAQSFAACLDYTTT